MRGPQGLVHELVIWNDTGNQAGTLGPFGGHQAAGQDSVQGPGFPSTLVRGSSINTQREGVQTGVLS